MRRYLWYGSLIIFLVLLLATCSATYATSIPIRGNSSYGVSNASVGGSSNGAFTGGSFMENTVCPFPDLDGSNCFAFAYVFSLSLTPPSGSTSLTLDFPTAPSGSLALLFCDISNSIPCGTLPNSPISGTLGPDSGTGQKIVFTDLSQLQGQTVALIFTDNFNPNDDSISVPGFSAAYGTSSVATPEPASLALLGIGLASLSGKLRRKHA